MCHQNGGEISPGELLHGGLFNPIVMDIFAMYDIRHGIRIHVSGKYSPGIFLPFLFFGKSKSLSHPS